MKIISLLLLPVLLAGIVRGQQPDISTERGSIIYLNLPERKTTAAGGSIFASLISGKSLEEREKAVVKEILNGNVPSFSRKLKPITVNKTVNLEKYELTFFTVCDYMAIGSDEDYLYMPMTPSTAQYLADELECSLPTKKMVDLIYNAAEIKLYPQPIPPSDKMTTVPVFKQHTDSIKLQISQLGFDRSADSIIAGHKKDVIISNKIYSSDRNYDRVVIYGWHLGVNNPIQPVYNGHIAAYADYSHGIRFIADTVWLNGNAVHIDSVLENPELSVLLSDEGVIEKPYYPPSDIFTSIKNENKIPRENFGLLQNYPNPFNPSTTITYTIHTSEALHAKSQQLVQLKIYDILGREVATLVNKKQLPGTYVVEFNASGLTSGIYLCRLKAGSFGLNRKLLLLK